jgi:heptosyltransferase-2
MTRRSLIVKLGAIGDVVSVLPAAWKLYQSGSTIDWVCGRGVAPLLSCYSWVHPIVVNDAALFGGRGVGAIAEVLRTWGRLIGSSYDLCAILQYDRRYRILAFPVRTRRTITLQHSVRAFRLVSERHHSAEFARILCGEPDGYNKQNFAPIAPDQLPDNLLPRNGKVRIALAPGGARNLLRDDAQRRWPVDSYVKLAKLLLDKDYDVVLTGGPGDTWVEPQFNGLPVDNRIGHWQIPQTIAFYQSCDCVVTHDSGPMHLAGLASCGLIGLFGPTAPSKALPRRNGVVGLWGGERLPCRPCYDGRTFAACNWNGCMISISPQRVAATVESLLADAGSEWRVENL